MEIDLNRERLDLSDPQELEELTPMLANLQGNILKSHGRDHAVMLFLEFFIGDSAAVKKWISTFSQRYITSAFRQYYEAREREANEGSGRLFAGFYLSADGYKALGFDDLARFDESTPSDKEPSVRFAVGMKDSKCIEALKDPFPEKWEKNYQTTIHAMVLLADDDPERLTDVQARVKGSLDKAVRILFEEDGFVLRSTGGEAGKPGRPIEHFGFRDGISQPLFFKNDIEKELSAGALATGQPQKWDPSAPLNLALVSDPFAGKDNCFGSYLVFRKLEQNVKKFREIEAALAVALNLQDSKKELAGALVVGRFRNGVPVILYDMSEPSDRPNFNDFDYKHQDASKRNKTQSKCPYHAHIRKTNPRGDFIFDAKIDKRELDKRIVRRGINYDNRSFSDVAKTLDRPEQGAGLMFMCFQSKIPNQFGFIQGGWATETGFPAIQEDFDNLTNSFRMRVIGVDPILERNITGNGAVNQNWCPVWGVDGGEKQFHFSDVVTLKGGEFFFAPSIYFLNNLAPEIADPMPHDDHVKHL